MIRLNSHCRFDQGTFSFNLPPFRRADEKCPHFLDYVIIARHEAAARGPPSVAELH
jgi:hypothetical protein